MGNEFLKARLKYIHNWRLPYPARVVSLGSWCHLKDAWCRKHKVHAIHRRGPHSPVATRYVLIHEASAHKEIALQYRERYGSTLIGFEHGHTFGRHIDPHFDEKYGWMDRFVVVDFGGRWWTESATIPIEGVRTDYYDHLRSRPGDTVFLMGYPFKEEGRVCDWLPDHDPDIQAALHQRLIDMMERQGWKWIYKAHPQRGRETQAYLTIPKGKCITKPFEQIHNKASMIIHTTSDSTTFGLSLFLGKPIILYDYVGKPWVKDAKRDVMSRCFWHIWG